MQFILRRISVPIRKLVVFVIAAWTAHVSALRPCQAQPAGDAPPPFTLLYDTGVVSPGPLALDALSAKKGWSAIPEDNLTHVFTGDAVFMNDRLAVVLRRGGSGAAIYSRPHGGVSQRAALLPLAADGAAGALSGVKIIENSQAAVMIEAAIKTQAGATAVFRFRLSAGEALLEVRGGPGAGRLRISDEAKYVVVPDFFADDMVFDPSTHEASRVGLPAENSLLGLTDDGKAIVTCVWPSSRQTADLLLTGEGAQRNIAGYEIDLPDNNRLWIAVMEGAGIWHARRVTDEKGAKELALQWQPPMPARWRADFVTAAGDGVSTSFADAKSVAENPRADGRCRFDSGRALVRMADLASPAAPRLIVVYPVERTRTTPLTAFCLVDIMRNALGVGPCQYVLDAERIGAADNPTPEPVTHWVEKQFEKKPSKRDPDAIRDQLSKMTQQVKRTDARIGDYVSFGLKVKQACADAAKSPENATAAGRLAAIADSMAGPPAALAPAVEKLAADVAAQAEQTDALVKSEASITAIRAAGAAQDYALAKLRMAARRLKQEARTLAAADPKTAGFAGEIQQQAGQMLVRK
jgi:hypothetical protein